MPADGHKTAYSPGDLYDLLTTSPETRFHAVYLFLRYLLLVRSSSLSSDDTDDTGSAISEDEEEDLDADMEDMMSCGGYIMRLYRSRTDEERREYIRLAVGGKKGVRKWLEERKA